MKDEMNSREATKTLKGKVIQCVRMNRRRNSGDGHTGWTSNPDIIFTDGSSISFFTIETMDEYGTDILYCE